MTRMRTLIAAALLTIPMLTVSATTPTAVDQPTQVMRDGPLPTPQTGWQCVWMAGYWWCF
jgi:hypothetical protein